jgi:hypothetical protein
VGVASAFAPEFGAILSLAFAVETTVPGGKADPVAEGAVELPAVGSCEISTM